LIVVALVIRALPGVERQPAAPFFWRGHAAAASLTFDPM
jgi:hypothetical protein